MKITVKIKFLIENEKCVFAHAILAGIIFYEPVKDYKAN
jgi:hypothetical protein